MYIYPSLCTCSHVLLQIDSVKPPVTPLYTAPPPPAHKVLTRNYKDFITDVNSRCTTVST